MDIANLRHLSSVNLCFSAACCLDEPNEIKLKPILLGKQVRAPRENTRQVRVKRER